MLVLSRKKQQSVVDERSNGFERLLKVSMLDNRGERAKPGFGIEDDISDTRLKRRDRNNANGPLKYRKGRAGAPKEEMSRWDDDGGSTPSPSPNVAVLDSVSLNESSYTIRCKE